MNTHTSKHTTSAHTAPFSPYLWAKLAGQFAILEKRRAKKQVAHLIFGAVGTNILAVPLGLAFIYNITINSTMYTNLLSVLKQM